MIDLNIANFLTIGIIAVLFYAILVYLLNMFGMSTNWLAGAGGGQ